MKIGFCYDTKVDLCPDVEKLKEQLKEMLPQIKVHDSLVVLVHQFAQLILNLLVFLEESEEFIVHTRYLCLRRQDSSAHIPVCQLCRRGNGNGTDSDG